MKARTKVTTVQDGQTSAPLHPWYPRIYSGCEHCPLNGWNLCRDCPHLEKAEDEGYDMNCGVMTTHFDGPDTADYDWFADYDDDDYEYGG